MGYENRDYHRHDYGGGTAFQRTGRWLLAGRVPLFRAFGIDVRAHSSLVIAIVLTLLFLPLGKGYTWQDAVASSALLFLIVLLHEFGHCFAARWSGGEADEIVMHPLGGLALTRPLSNWRAHLITVAGGPAVNLAICIVCGVGLYAIRHELPWRPFYIEPWQAFRGWLEPAWLLFWVYQTSWTLFLFNLLPFFPLDGGQLVQALLWSRLGYYRSMTISVNVGIVGAITVAMIGLASGSFTFVILAALGFSYCVQMRRQLQEMGPYAFGEYDDPFAAALERSKRENRRANRGPTRADQRAAKRIAAARAERVAAEAEIDRILAKVSASGMHSLTRGEQRTLRDATERQKRDDAKRPTANRR